MLDKTLLFALAVVSVMSLFTALTFQLCDTHSFKPWLLVIVCGVCLHLMNQCEEQILIANFNNWKKGRK